VVTFCAVTPEITFHVVYRHIGTGQQLANRSLFVALAFRNALDYWNADNHIKSGDDQFTSDINFGGFLSINSGVNAAQLYTADVVQH